MDIAEIDNHLVYLQANAIKKSPVHGYAVGTRDYIQFCLLHHLPLDPTSLTLAQYITYTSQFIASGPKYLSSVQHFLHDLYPDFNINHASLLVKATIRGSKKLRANPICRKEPLYLAHLSAFLHIAEATQHYDNMLFITILSCAFYACHRIGELLVPRPFLFDWRKIIQRSTLDFPPGHAQYHLSYHKSDPFFQGTTILLMSQSIADPVSLLLHYVSLQDQLHDAHAPLFLTEDDLHPTRLWFEQKFFTILDCSFGGQSAHADRATFYASLGISEDVIQAIGHWASATWKIYLREHPTVHMEQQLASACLHPQSFTQQLPCTFHNTLFSNHLLPPHPTPHRPSSLSAFHFLSINGLSHEICGSPCHLPL